MLGCLGVAPCTGRPVEPEDVGAPGGGEASWGHCAGSGAPHAPASAHGGGVIVVIPGEGTRGDQLGKPTRWGEARPPRLGCRQLPLLGEACEGL